MSNVIKKFTVTKVLLLLTIASINMPSIWALDEKDWWEKTVVSPLKQLGVNRFYFIQFFPFSFIKFTLDRLWTRMEMGSET